MLKSILSLKGSHALSKVEQSMINGGQSRCCIRKPSNGFLDDRENRNWCNSNPQCCKSDCACQEIAC